MVDAHDKKINLASRFVTQAGQLVDLYYAIKKFDAEYVKDGIQFAAGDFDGSLIKHVDPADLPTLITWLTDFVAWYESVNTDILLKVQRGD